MRSGFHRAARGLIAAACLAFLAAGCAKQDDVIRIGEFGSLTGSTATFGISTRRGIDMAVEEVNAAGGIHGRAVRVIVEDDQGKPEEAATVVQKLINQDRVIAVLGEVASSRSLAAAPICQDAKIPMITPASTNPKVTQVGDYVFRVCFIDPEQGSVMAGFAFRTLGARTAAILTDVKNDYSVGLADFFEERFTQLGGAVVAEESYTEGDIDFKAQLTAIKAKGPEVLFVPGYYTEVGLIGRQAKELGLSARLLGGDGWDSPRLFEIAQGSLEGFYFTNHYSVDDPAPEVQRFVGRYRAKYNETPDAMAVLGYDAANVLFAAMKQVPGLEPAKIRDAIAATKAFPGVTGSITLNAERNAEKPMVVLQIRGTNLAVVEKVSPT
jgi:branched-chain amino acid transport system substrate-binding protein